MFPAQASKRFKPQNPVRHRREDHLFTNFKAGLVEVEKSNRCWRSIVQRVRNLRAARPGDSDGFDPVGGGLEARANLFRLSGEPPRAQQREASVSSLSISLPVWAPLSRMAGTSCVPLFFLSVLRAHLAS